MRCLRVPSDGMVLVAGTWAGVDVASAVLAEGIIIEGRVMAMLAVMLVGQVVGAAVGVLALRRPGT